MSNPWDKDPSQSAEPWDLDPTSPTEAATPIPPSKPFLERLGAGAEQLNAVLKAIGTDANAAFSAGAREGFGSGPLGFEPGGAAEKWFRDNGIITDPATGKAGPLRFLNEAILRPATVLVDFADRAVKAGVGGIAGLVGKRAEQVTGDETEGKVAKREVTNLLNWALMEGGGVLTALRYTPSGLQELPLGRMPIVEDFIQTADIMGQPKSKELLRRLYDEKGIHPAEVMADALEDVTIAQDLAAGQMPGYYVKNPQPGKALTIAEAQRSDNKYIPSDNYDPGPQSLELVHGSNQEPIKKFSDKAPDSGWGDDGDFGQYTYLAEPGDAKWHDGTMQRMSLPKYVYDVTANFKRPILITPETLAKVVEDFGTKPYGKDFAKLVEERGFDGVIVRGFDRLHKLEDHPDSFWEKLARDLKLDKIEIPQEPMELIGGGFEAREPIRASTLLQSLTDQVVSLRPGENLSAPRSKPLPPLKDLEAKASGGGGGGKPPGGPLEPAATGEPPSGGKGDLTTTGDKGALSTHVEGKRTYEEAREQILNKMQSSHRPDENLTFDQLYTRLVDDLNPIKSALEKEGITGLLTSEDPYALFRLTRGSFGKADQMLLNNTYRFDTYENNGRGLRDILSDVKDEMRDFKAFLISKRAMELKGRGIESGFGVDNPSIVLEEAPNKVANFPKFEKIQKEIVDYQNRLSLYLRDAGVISPEAYRAMLEANKNYVPFFRFTDPQLFPHGTSGKGLAPKNPLKGIKGDEADIIDPIESIIKNTYAYIQIAEKNDASLKLIRLLQKSDRYAYYPQVQTALPGPNIAGHLEQKPPPQPKGPDSLPKMEDTLTAWDKKPSPLGDEFRKAAEAHESTPLVEKSAVPAKADAHFTDAEFEPVFDYYGIKDKDLKEFLSSIAREPTNNEIFAFDKGRMVKLKVDDQELLNAWRSLDRHSADMLTKLLSLPARALRAGVTLDPAFMLRNTVWDFYSALINTKGAIFSPLDFVSGATSYFKGRYTKGGDVDFNNWLKGGGANGTMYSLDRRYVQNNIEHLADPEIGAGARAWNVIRAPIDGLRAMGELLENATRLGEFKKIAGQKKFGADPAASEAGKAAIQAAAMAFREITIDYARIGSQMRAYNMITAFANANIQGTDRLFRAVKEHPYKTAATMIGGITAPSVLLWWANHDDPRYKQLPDWQKDLFWIVMTKDTIYRIPKPGTAGVVFGTGVERALDAYFNENPKALAKLTASIVGSMTPGVLPTFVTPMLEQATNASVMNQAKVIPAEVENQLPEYQYTPYTTELAKWIGRNMGAFPGMRAAANNSEGFGGAVVGGVARALTSPELIENYVRAWTGGLGDMVFRGTDALARKAGLLPDPPKPEDTLADLPIVKSFVVRYPGAAQPVSDFYEMNGENERVMNTFMSRMKSGDQTAAEEVARTYGVRMRLDKVKQTLSDLSQLARMTYKDPETPAGEKRQIIDTIMMRRIEIAEFGLGLLKQEKEYREQIERAANPNPRQREVEEQSRRVPGPQISTEPPARPSGATGFGDVRVP